jgi:hypothetical protein
MSKINKQSGCEYMKCEYAARDFNNLPVCKYEGNVCRYRGVEDGTIKATIEAALEEKDGQLMIACHVKADDKVVFDWAVLTKIDEQEQQIAALEAALLLEEQRNAARTGIIENKKKQISVLEAEQGKINDALGVLDHCQIVPLFESLTARIRKLEGENHSMEDHIHKIGNMYVNLKEALEKDKTPDFARGFNAGREAVLRRNPSGCCCKFTDEKEGEDIVSLCEAHKEYVEATLAKKDWSLTKGLPFTLQNGTILNKEIVKLNNTIKTMEIFYKDDLKIMDILREQNSVLEDKIKLLIEGWKKLTDLALENFNNWNCGCGHWNGTNLPFCAVCGRQPGEKE